VFVIGEVFGRVGAGEEGFGAVGRDDLVFGRCGGVVWGREFVTELICLRVLALV
jgi:hypothetical protein